MKWKYLNYNLWICTIILWFLEHYSKKKEWNVLGTIFLTFRLSLANIASYETITIFFKEKEGGYVAPSTVKFIYHTTASQ